MNQMSISKELEDSVKKRHFIIKYNLLQSTSEDFIKKVGLNICGIKRIDMELVNQWITTAAPIVKMVELFKDGQQIKIVKRSDVNTIYEIISTYLLSWRNVLENGINISLAPIDDLIQMDRFADSLYEFAKYDFSSKMVDSLLVREMSNVAIFNSNNFFSDKSNKRKIPEEGDYPERISIESIIKKRYINYSNVK